MKKEMEQHRGRTDSKHRSKGKHKANTEEKRKKQEVKKEKQKRIKSIEVGIINIFVLERNILKRFQGRIARIAVTNLQLFGNSSSNSIIRSQLIII